MISIASYFSTNIKLRLRTAVQWTYIAINRWMGVQNDNIAWTFCINAANHSWVKRYSTNFSHYFFACFKNTYLIVLRCKKPLSVFIFLDSYEVRRCYDLGMQYRTLFTISGFGIGGVIPVLIPKNLFCLNLKINILFNVNLYFTSLLS